MLSSHERTERARSVRNELRDYMNTPPGLPLTALHHLSEAVGQLTILVKLEHEGLSGERTGGGGETQEEASQGRESTAQENR